MSLSTDNIAVLVSKFKIALHAHTHTPTTYKQKWLISWITFKKIEKYFFECRDWPGLLWFF